MGDVDAGNVKAKASIEYDPSGLKQMKEDLASLEQAAGSAGQSAGQAGEKMAGFGEQMTTNAAQTKEFSSVLAELPKMVEAGGTGVVEMTDALVEQRSAMEEAGTAQETFNKQVETTATNLEKVAPAMQAATEHTRGLNENLSQAQQSFSDLSAAIAEPGATEAYTNLWKSVSGESLGASPLANFEVFQKAYNAIDSSGMYDAAGGMQMIDEHLDKTGQSYEQFAGSLGEKNQQLLHEMSMDWSQINTTMDGAGQSFQKAGEKAQTGFNTITSSAGDADQAVADFLGKTTKGVGELSGGFKPATLGGAFSEVMGGAMNVLNEIAMPLMAAQMIGMAVQQVGQALYDSAAIAEGPAAHSFGTFTGTVDALGQSLQRTGGQFSEGFGKEFLPTLNALNNQAGSSDGGWLGQLTGGVASTIANLSLITTGIDPWGGIQGLMNQGAEVLGMPQPFQGPAPVSQYQQQMAALPQTVRQNAQQLQYQSSLTMAQAVDPNWLAANNEAMASQRAAQYLVQSYDISHPLSQSKIIQQAREQAYDAQQEENYQYQMNNQPSIWQQAYDEVGGFFGGIGGGNGYLNSPTGSLMWGALAPANFIGNIANKGGIGNWLSGITTPTGDILSGIFGGHSPTLGDMWGGVSNMFGGIGSWFQGLFGSGNQSPQTFTGGCFVAGTPVLLADGREKAIEDVRVDDMVLSYDGTKQVVTPVLAIMQPAPKRVYKLTFDDGRTLTLTNAHPLQGKDGWKSLSPEATAIENPGLEVTPLVVGDVIQTVNGTITLTSILPLQGVRRIFNIEVGEPHTFYAGGVLVHNKVASQIGQQTAEQIGDIQLPHMDLSGMASQLGSNFSSIQLPHMDLSGISGSLAGVFSGITMPAIPDIGSQISGELGGMFSGISMPAIPDIGGQVSGALGGMFSGISMPSIPDIGGMLSGALSGMFGSISLPSIPDVGGMISGAMSGMFGGLEVPSPPDVGAMISGAMSGMFGGIVVPSPPDVGAMINGAMSGMFGGISVPSVPFFASGVSNFGGGPAIVGEGNAPEVVEANGRYSLFDQGATFVNLPAGASVYPMQEMGGYSSPRMLANGTGSGSFTPLSLGGGAPQSINVSVHLDSQAILEAIGMPLSQNIRVASAMRSY